jgi:hypothetical protein
MHGWKGEGGMVRQPVFCRRKNRIIKILVMKFIPLIWFVSGITNAARPGFRKPPGFVSNSGGFFSADILVANCRIFYLQEIYVMGILNPFSRWVNGKRKIRPVIHKKIKRIIPVCCV